MPNKISVLIDVAVDKATSGLKGFKASINDADGAVGKFKAGSGAAFDSLKAHAGQLALAGGAALVAFGAKAVMAFSDTALAAGKLADVTGLAVEDASKWIAVGDDIGVASATIQKSFGKMNVEIAKGGGALEEYGIGIVRAKDGTVDANATFLAAIDTIKGIQDPTKKAEAAQAAFGKGWQEMAELIEMGSGDIVTAMGEVSDAQVIDEEELAKARKLRESLDKLKDSVSDVAVELGEALTPAVATAADMLSTIAPVVGDVAGFVGDAFVDMADAAYEFGQGVAGMVDALPFVDLAEPIAETLYEQQKLARGTEELVAKYSAAAPTMDQFIANLREQELSEHAVNLAIIEYRKQLDEATEAQSLASETGRVYIDIHGNMAGAIEHTAESTEELTRENTLLADAIKRTEDRYRDLKGELSAEEAFHAAVGMFADLRTSAEEAMTAAETGADDAAAAMFDHQGSVIAAKQEVVDLGEKYADLPESEVTAIVALIDEGQLEEAERRFNILTRNREMNISIIARGGQGYSNLPNFAGGGTVPGAMGSPQLIVAHGGEHIFDPRSHITPHNQLAAAWGGSSAAPAAAAGAGNTYVMQSLVSPNEAQLQTFSRWVDVHEQRRRGML